MYNNRYDQDLRRWADVRNTSIDLASAILTIAGEDEKKANRIWEDPTPSEIEEIKKVLDKEGISYDEEYWGAEGNRWYRESKKQYNKKYKKESKKLTLKSYLEKKLTVSSKEAQLIEATIKEYIQKKKKLSSK